MMELTAQQLHAQWKIANEAHLYQYEAVVLRVVDGDTFDLQIDLGFNTFVRRRVRLYGVNTPEVRGPERDRGLLAKDRVRELIEGKDVVIISCDYNDCYGRCVAKILIPDMNRQDLGDLLLEEGHAEEYFG